MLQRKIANVLALLTVFFVFACGDETVEPIQVPSSLTLIENTLHFKDLEEFQNTYEQLTEANDPSEILGNIEFNSHANAFDTFIDELEGVSDDDFYNFLYDNSELYEIITDEEGERELVSKIDEDMIAKLFNREGIIYIGDKALKLDYNHLYETTISNRHLLNDNLSDPAVVVSSVIRQDLGSEQARVEAKECIVKYADNKRLKGSKSALQFQNLAISITWRSKHQKKRLGLWTGKKINQIEVAAGGRLNGILFSTGKEEFDSNSASKTKVVCIVDVGPNGNVEYCGGNTGGGATHNMNYKEYGCTTTF